MRPRVDPRMSACWLITALLGAAACSQTGAPANPTPDGPCEGKAMAELRKALPTLELEMQASVALVGLGEACAARLPAPISEIMRKQVDPSEEATLVAGALAESIAFARVGCPDFPKVFGAVAAAAPTDKARLLHEQCGYAKQGVFSLAEYQSALDQRAGAAYLAPLLYAWLVEQGMLPKDARALVRAAAAVERYPGS
jgi:hypothetical protein